MDRVSGGGLHSARLLGRFTNYRTIISSGNLGSKGGCRPVVALLDHYPLRSLTAVLLSSPKTVIPSASRGTCFSSTIQPQAVSLGLLQGTHNPRCTRQPRNISHPERKSRDLLFLGQQIASTKARKNFRSQKLGKVRPGRYFMRLMQDLETDRLRSSSVTCNRLRIACWTRSIRRLASRRSLSFQISAVRRSISHQPTVSSRCSKLLE